MPFEINWATWVTGSVGVLFSVYFALKGKKEKVPRYTLEDNNLFEQLPNLIPDLRVDYKGEQIANLTITRLRFWNAGKDTLNNEDVVQPILIEAQDGCRILSAQVISVIHEANEFKVLPTAFVDKKVTLSFRYLDYKEGGKVHIAHTGTGKGSLKLTGRVKQAGIPKQIICSSPKAPQQLPPTGWGRVLPVIAMLLLTLIPCTVFVLTLLKPPQQFNQIDMGMLGMLGLFSIFLPVFFAFLAYGTLVRQWPEGLD